MNDMEMYKINILWTTASKKNFMDLVSTYAYNAKINGWWEEVNIIIWGESATLVKEDPEVRAELEEMLKRGIKIQACKECSDKIGLTEIMREIGIEVDYLGSVLTSRIKDGEPVLTV